MKKVIIVLGTVIGCYFQSQAQLPQLGKASNSEVIAAMTLEEKVQFVEGVEIGGIDEEKKKLIKELRAIVPGAGGNCFPIPRLGITPMVFTDGPAGVHINSKRPNTPGTFFCTAFPTSTLLASTWNLELMQFVGTAFGNEELEYGGDVLLAPGMNIHRNPLCGRNFEYYSEDPLLAGKMAAAFVKGVQSQGVGASIKHFACNNQETNRRKDNVIVSQRALREIYLKGFEIAVKESNPWTVMTSYNKLNGLYTSENPVLISTILRKEWGFKGMVMSDWNGGTNAVAQMLAGNDMIQPGERKRYDSILAALKSGALPVAVIDSNISRILDLVQKTPRFKGVIRSNKPDLKAHAVITRKSATEGLVLLKNENNILPFNNSIKNIALLGVCSYDLFTAGGTGSGNVNKAYVVNLQQGLSNAGYSLETTIKSGYAKYMNDSFPRVKSYNDSVHGKPHLTLTEWIPTENELKASTTTANVALITIGRNAGENYDRKIKYDFLLTDDEKSLIINTCNTFHQAGKKVVVLLNITGVIETASWKDLPDAILTAWQPGQEGGNSVVDVLKGAENPSGKLTMTFPINYEDVPSAKNFPSDYATEVNGSKDKKRNFDYTRYEEGIYVGYRHYSTVGKPVSYPFGYGLSYTSFAFSKLQVRQYGDDVVATVTITNTGKRAGKEVAELYITAPKGKLDKPALELKAFAKTKLLQPKESQTVEMIFNKRNLASFDESLNAWVTDKGNYTISVGSSVADIRAKADYMVEKDWEEKVEGE